MSRKRLKKVNKILYRVNQYADTLSRMSDQQLQGQTKKFRDKIAHGDTLDKILPEAFATIREADKRILGKFPYDVQVLGGIVLHQGNIAEMKTGEGKTLTATMPVYLNALTGQGVMVITTNSYLSNRDYNELKEVYEWLGLSVSSGTHEDPNHKFTTEDKKNIYNSDIIYTTNDVLGFDYLQENLVSQANDQFLRPYNYAILDEVDSILLDSAQMPLIISGAPRVQSNLFSIANQFVNTLIINEDFEMDDEKKHVWLTDVGLSQAKRFFNRNKFYSADNYMLVKHIQLALHARTLFKLNRDYVVEDNEVKLLDITNGRIMVGTKLQSGLHQAIEAKEGLEITQQMRAVASITYQNLFRMFKKLSGMTGTGRYDEEEFIQTYNMAVVVIPTHKPLLRKDYPDKVYTTLPEKLYASMELVIRCHEQGQPVLLTTGSVELSEIYSQMLLKQGIAHNVLNARNVAKEAEIISEAGQLGAVTVATVMAGRGTDIKLGRGVAEKGGLAVIGTERMTSKRIDMQLRGRAGRQGDPGFSQFFVSLEDDIVINRGSERMHKYYQEHMNDFDVRNPKELKKRRFTSVVNKAQAREESQARSARQNALEFDEISRIQRNLIYATRKQLLEATSVFDDEIMKIAVRVVDNFLDRSHFMTQQHITRFILDNLNYNLKKSEFIAGSRNKEQIRDKLIGMIVKLLTIKYRNLKSYEGRKVFQRIAILKAVDTCWIDQVDQLQQLKNIVINRQFSQKNPIFEYQKEARNSFKEMKKQVDKAILKNIMLSDIDVSDNGKMTISFP
ncbi:accessory Sec system translocase SecA2 [Leuconostoc pseudomesenteroides]|uniref:Protein translocase subunit SecA n=1 Tax=Leuconostoc pseudomesenteroides TaxID=33968 RepID=A0ABT6HE11_LEUPS|nr:accessory Sec system translocase SecA2 [Leuconostoc pseudomesenteroides]MDG9734147.1 accessory Sec system translocase SecA2 [Leuconostoc pseudomesenteroides]NKZ35324.1 accessory Sec system translocase SecA2 [Leuconostoc pseudomesenteroides]QQB27767.1 accessory Sec system translocase SecA2 [Leuconostoc pseudomesenteroides]